MNVNELSTNELNELRETYYDQLLTSDKDVLGDITSAFELDILPRFDYIILDECNHWISTGFQETQEQIDQEVEELVSNTDLKIFVFKAKKLIRTDFQGTL